MAATAPAIGDSELVALLAVPNRYVHAFPVARNRGTPVPKPFVCALDAGGSPIDGPYRRLRRVRPEALRRLVERGVVRAVPPPAPYPVTSVGSHALPTFALAPGVGR